MSIELQEPEGFFSLTVSVPLAGMEIMISSKKLIAYKFS